MSIVARAIWHIESRLSNEITLNDVAATAGVSRFHIERAFSAATGLSVMRYVRARRLSEAAKALRQGAPSSILTIALEARYGSHEAFTRAFVDHFGVTPRAARSDACRHLALQEPITVNFSDSNACAPSRIVTMRPMQIVGLRHRYSFAARAGVPLTWERFAVHIGEITGEVAGAAFGVIDEWADDGGFHYLAGVEVDPTAKTPGEFARLSIPTRACAIFHHSGHISSIRKTLQSIWSMWMPTVPYEIDEAPVIERYGPLFDPRSGDGGLEIWIPLRSGANASNSTSHSKRRGGPDMTSPSAEMLEYYATAEAMPSPGKRRGRFDRLPADVAQLSAIPKTLALHAYLTEAYSFDPPESRKQEMHLRTVEAILNRIVAMDDRPLKKARPPERRLIGVCVHFVVLLTAMLRAKGIPARARCGFASYFNPGYFEDHWLCEYWSKDQKRWIRLDAQLDDTQCARFDIDFDIHDVPRDRFLIAADAWTQCRLEKADPMRFGIAVGDKRGLWFIAGDLIRDLAALNKVEVLPWDVWGAMPQPDQSLGKVELDYFDHLADVTHQAASLQTLQSTYLNDPRLVVPTSVLNSLRGRFEPVL